MNISLDPFTKYKYIRSEGSILTEQTLYCYKMNITGKMNIICHLAGGQTRVLLISLLYLVLCSYGEREREKKKKRLKCKADAVHIRQLCCSHLVESQ